MNCNPVKFANYEYDVLTSLPELYLRITNYYLIFRDQIKDEYGFDVRLSLSIRQLQKCLVRYESGHKIYSCTKGLQSVTTTKLLALLLVCFIKNKVVRFHYSTSCNTIFRYSELAKINCLFLASFIKDYVVKCCKGCRFFNDEAECRYMKYIYELQATLDGEINPMHIAFAFDSFIEHPDNIYI